MKTPRFLLWSLSLILLVTLSGATAASNGFSNPVGLITTLNTADTAVDNTPTWNQIFPSNPPSPRGDFGLVYDSDRSLFVIFGGHDGSYLLNETWEYDGATWSQHLTPQSPGGRRRPAVAYNPVRRVTVLFGGSNADDSVSFNDTWEYDGQNWVQRAAQNPPSPRNGAMMAYDHNRGRMVLFGGYCYCGGDQIFYDETWEYDGLVWTQRFPTVHPAARETASMVYDSYRDRVILFGGGRMAGSTVFGDTWEWDGNTWTPLSPPTSPPARWAQAMAYDQRRHRIVLFGGLAGSSAEFSDTWEYDSAANNWSEVVMSPSPPERWGHGMAFDPVKQVMVLFGGVYYQSGYWLRNDTWHYQGTQILPQRPVVLLPGVMGSELYTHVIPGCDDPYEKVWIDLLKLLPLDDPILQHLQLSSDGYSAVGCNNIKADNILYSVGPFDFYQILYDNLQDNGYQVTLCPYDWRRSVIGERYDSEYQHDLARRVDQCVEIARGGDPDLQVDLVAHSMGGVLARQYVLSSPERASKVHTIVTLGTPYWGSAEILLPLRYGQAMLPIDPILNNDRVRELLHNAPSAYQLLPSQTFFEQIGWYFAIVDAEGQLHKYGDYSSMRTFLSQNYNSGLTDQAEDLHAGAFDDWRDDGLGVEYYVFSGTGVSTPRWIVELQRRHWGGGTEQTVVILNLPWGGDGTVLSHVATLQGKQGSFAGDATVCQFFFRDHGALTRDASVWAEIDKALRGLPLSCLLGAQRNVRPASESAESRQFLEYGHAVVHVWDEQGRHTGPDGSGLVEENIPLVTYQSTDAQTLIDLPPVSFYTITLQMTDSQPITLKFLTVQSAMTLEEAISQTVIFQDVPSATGGRARMVYNPLGDPNTFELEVDLDGDGTTDMIVHPSSVLDHQDSADWTPPTTNIAVEGEQDACGFFTGLVTITLQSTDTGSGVYKIEYSLDHGQTGHAYSEPFTIRAEDVPVLYAQAVDQAGNMEYPWAEQRLRPYSLYLPFVLKIDCFSGPEEIEPNDSRAEANGPLCFGQTYWPLPDDLDDYFYLDTGAGTLTVQVGDYAPGDYGQLMLQDAAGGLVAWDSSLADGGYLQSAVEAGRYYIRVYTADGHTSQPYSLLVSYP